MSFDAEEHSQSYHEKEYDHEADGTVLDKAEADVEYKIQDREDYWEPRISVHHGDAEKVGDPLCFIEMDLDDEHQDSVDKYVDIEGDNDGPYDPLADKAFKIILLGVEAFDESVAGTEKEDGYEVDAGVYEC
jgi:hypothetical protein